MGDTGIVRFPGTLLDPRAQEFRPTYHFPLVPSQIYFQFPYPASGDVPVMPFSEGGVAYPQFTSQPAYVRPAVADPPLPPPLPPPSMTPSRTLLLSSVPTDVSESTVRRDLEIFGDVRAVQMERVRDGIVTVHFYDLRHAQAALLEIQDQHMQQQCRMRMHFDSVFTHNSPYETTNLAVPLPPPAAGLISGRAVWAQFMIPVTFGYPEGHNQGTIVIFNVNSEVPTSSLRHIFEAFGAVKELRETPLKRHQRFVEFYDTRDASKALAEMNEKEIYGKQVFIEFSRPGGISKRLSKTTQHATTNKFNSMPRSPRCLALPPSPPSQPPPLSGKLSGRAPAYVHPRCYNSQAQFPAKKSGYSERNPSGNRKTNGWTRVEAAMASLCVSGEDCKIDRLPKKNSKKSTFSTSSISMKQQLIKGGAKPWKGSKGSKDYDPRFLINEDAIVVSNSSDSRTTVMIKNIPNKYSQKLLLNMLDNHCIHCNEQIGDDQPMSSYDFVYLPIDFINKCNVGYGFVNMTSPEATLRLYKSFHLQNWEVFNSRKICQVTYARLQGVEALKDHFRNSKFPCEAEEYMPVVFSPPRDGRTLTEPVPIVGRPTNNSINPPPPTPTPTVTCGEEGECSKSSDDYYDDDDDLMDFTENGEIRSRSIINVVDNDDVSGGSSQNPNGGDVVDDDDDDEENGGD